MNLKLKNCNLKGTKIEKVQTYREKNEQKKLTGTKIGKAQTYMD